MIDALFNDSYYVAAKKMLDVNVLRHEAIASNLANVETPNYKRVDVSQSFENQLQQAIGTKDNSQISNLQPAIVVDPFANPSRGDGNTVQLEDEMLKLNQNVVEHSLGVQLVNDSLARMRMAISGKS